MNQGWMTIEGLRTDSVSLPRVVDIERTHSVSLLKAIQRGDVVAVKVMEDLIWLMSRKDMEIQDDNGDAALSLAAYNGITEIAKCLVRKNRNLVTIPNHEGKIPLVVACAGDHKDMTYHLYSETPLDFLSPENGDHGSLLLDCCIVSKMFGRSYIN
ncbi:hypothetical protein SLA2020_382050 [Shorea laevis]